MPEAPPKAELSLGGKLVRYGGILFIISAVCVGLINFVYSMTREKILAEQEKKIMKGVCAIFDMPLEKSSEVNKAENVTISGDRKTTFFDCEGKLACIVRPVGYDGPITMIVGYQPSADKLLGIYIVSHTETPGFGARFMEKKQGKSLVGHIVGEEVPPPTELDRQTFSLKFQQPYYNKPASVFEQEDLKKCGDKEIADGITGATISSKAVYAGVRDAIAILKNYRPGDAATAQ